MGFDLPAAIRDERLDLCDFVAAIEPQAWSTPSLCVGWTVREVVAHLALSTTETWRSFLGGMLRYRGNFDRLVAARAAAHAAGHGPEELIAQLRTAAGSTRRSPGSAPLDPLLDLLVHGQDIARAIGVPRSVPTERAIPALEHAVASRWYGAKRRLTGLQLAADDANWSHGAGPTVTGSVTALLLVATGRRQGLAELRGDGTNLLGERLHQP